MNATPQIGREDGFYAFLHRTTSHLRSARETDTVVRHYLRASVGFFGAEAGCVAVLEPGEEEARIVFSQPSGAPWDRRFLSALIGEQRPDFPRGLICSLLMRRGRPWGVIALRRAGGRFERWQERAIAPVASEIVELIERIDRERLAEVRARIDGKIMRELAPKDLYYQILDGLHQLTRYDHSAALYILDPDGRLQLVAEQIQWRKLKSERIGATLELTEDIASLLGGGLVYGFDRPASKWQEWTGRGAIGLAEALEDGASPRETDSAMPTSAVSGRAAAATPAASGSIASVSGRAAAATPAASGSTASVSTPAASTSAIPAPPVRAMLCAALGTHRGSLGLLRLAALRPGAFGSFEREIIARFAPIVALVLQRSQSVISLQERMLLVERRSTLAHIARGVAHDINNALGAVAPLVQQIRSEIESGGPDPETLREDLARIESSIEVCRRIFSGMLRVARGSARHDGVCDLGRAVETAMGVLRESLARQGVEVETELPREIPAVFGRQEDVERVLLNLATNAREAMPRGGTLRLAVDRREDWVRVRIEDTGRGVPAEIRRQIETPFFSTKPEGWGLGLATCRSIMSEIGGELEIESVPERGTRVTVRLKPIAVHELAT